MEASRNLDEIPEDLPSFVLLELLSLEYKKDTFDGFSWLLLSLGKSRSAVGA
jgi:hypothetical protein